jgi:hypothetical protein
MPQVANVIAQTGVLLVLRMARARLGTAELGRRIGCNGDPANSSAAPGVGEATEAASAQSP